MASSEVTAVDENRREPRLPVEVKIDYRTVGSFITDYTRNISKGGTFIRTSLPLDVGERVRLRLTVPGGEPPFALDGVVKWVSTLRDKDKHPPGMGVEFVDFDDRVRMELERLVGMAKASGEPTSEDG
ncbi:MAG: TIGR02266 family protein [Deltaproteobacteria bacterium]|nr:TIGR02266 family protein [Deltaproteobacteria bacterium]